RARPGRRFLYRRRGNRRRSHRVVRVASSVPDVSPAAVLAPLVGVFHAGLYLAIRGSVGLRFPFVVIAAVLGSFAGQAIAARVGDPWSIGDLGLLWTSAFAWLGIVVIAAASLLSPTRESP